MKRLSCLAVLIVFVFVSCSDVEESPGGGRRGARYPSTRIETDQSLQQPYNPNQPPPPPENTAEMAPPEASASPTTRATKGDLPYGIPVPNKPHLVESPFSPGKYVDVEGFAPGTEVKDPYTGKIFLVP